MQVCVLEHPRIRSEKRFNDIANTPLWSCLMGGYAASSLKDAGHEVVYLDAAGPDWDFEKTKELILRLSPGLLTINTVYIWEHTQTVFDFFSQLKNEGFSGHLNLFGFFPTLAYKDILEKTFVCNSIAVGECEHTLAALANALQDRTSLLDIKGLAVRKPGGGIFFRASLPEKVPDRFPFPIRHHHPSDTVSILASRGCYNHCRFCPIPSFYNQGPLWRGRTPENILDEIKMLTDEGCSDFYFADPNFIGPGRKGKKRVIKLMDLIRPLKITFGLETRPEDLDEEILEKMVDAGFTSLLLGVESGSPAVLGKLEKKTPLSASENAIRLLRQFDIEPAIGFLMFVPDSRREDLRQNYEFLIRNNLLDSLERTVNLLSHRQIVLKGTSGYLRFQRQGRLTPTGFLGTEGAVSYLDDSVYAISELIIHACHLVLKKMEKDDSPIYWKKGPDSVTHRLLNDYLADLFKSLIEDVRSAECVASISDIKMEIEDKITALMTPIALKAS